MFVMATDVDGGLPRLGQAEPAADRAVHDRTAAGRTVRGRVDGARRSRRPSGSSKRTGRPGAAIGGRWPRSRRSSTARPARATGVSDRHERPAMSEGRQTMPEFGVHSEVGQLRKVMVHRPDLSLRRLTPSNHDDLLFDDVLWVERAQYEHDQFVARMRERGVEVFHLQDLLGEALAADDDGPAPADRARGVGVHGRPVPGRRGPRRAGRAAGAGAGPAPHRRADRRRGRPRPRPLPRAVPAGGGARRHQRLRPATAAEHPVHPRLVLLDLRRRLHQPDVLAGAAAGGVQRRRDLPRPPHVHAGVLRVLVSGARRRRPVQRGGLRPLHTGGR